MLDKKYFYTKLGEKGFTLVELIVVIAIIGIISTIGTASYTNYLKTARDAVRKSQMVEVQKALEAYYVMYGSYPTPTNPSGQPRGLTGVWTGYFRSTSSGATSPWIECCNYKDLSGNSGYIPGLAPFFIEKLPVDPKGSDIMEGYLYNSLSNGQGYKLLNHSRTVVGEIFPNSFADPRRPTWSLMVCDGKTLEDKRYACCEGNWIDSTYATCLQKLGLN